MHAGRRNGKWRRGGGGRRSERERRALPPSGSVSQANLGGEDSEGCCGEEALEGCCGEEDLRLGIGGEGEGVVETFFQSDCDRR